jgi:transposase
LLTIARDQIPREQAYNMIQIERGVPALIAARDLVDRFHAMIRNRKPEELDPWIAAAKESCLASFATGIASDRDAVRAALVQPWSNGQTEGQITKLKLVKRQMYGRAKRSCPRWWCRRPLTGLPERPPRMRRRRAGWRPPR